MLAKLRPYLQFWRTVVTVVAPLLLCPLVFVINTSEAKENVNFVCQLLTQLLQNQNLNTQLPFLNTLPLMKYSRLGAERKS